MKKFLVVLLVLAMIFGLSAVALSAKIAVEDQTIYLKGSGKDFKEVWENLFYLGGAEDIADPNLWHLVYSGDNSYDVTYMQLKFTNGEGFEWKPDNGFSWNGGGNNWGWVIAAPSDWELDYVDKGNNNDSECFLRTIDTGNVNFNISGFHQGKPDLKYGSLEVSVNAQEKHIERTIKETYERNVWNIYERKMKETIWREIWDICERDVWDIYERNVWKKHERDINEYYERNVWKIYERSVWDIYERDTWDIMQRDVWDILQRKVQPFMIPVFEKKIIQAGTDTLVTGRNDNTVPGGTFGNGMTYLEIDVAKARTEGYTFQIADSSPNNKNVGYSYNVRIEGNNLIVSFDDSFITADVTAKVYSTAPTKHDPSGHKTLRTGQDLPVPLPTPSKPETKASVTAVKQGNDVIITIPGVGSITVAWEKNAKGSYQLDGYTVEVEYNGNGVKSAKITDQPITDPAEEGVVYLFFHLASGIKYYATGEYKFVKWEFKFSEESPYKTVGNDASGFYKVDDGASEYVKTRIGATPYKEIGKKASDYTLVKTDIGGYVVTDCKTKYVKTGEDATEYVKTGEGEIITNSTKEKISDDFLHKGKTHYIKTGEKINEVEVYDNDYVAEFGLVIELVVEDGENIVVYDGTIKSGEGKWRKFDDLTPGEYKLILSYNDVIIYSTDVEVDSLEKYATVFVNGIAPVLFDDILINGPKKIIDLEPIRIDHEIDAKYIEKIVKTVYVDTQLPDKEIDNKVKDKRIDNKLPDKLIDNVIENHKSNKVKGEFISIPDKDRDEYIDILKADVHLPDNGIDPVKLADKILPNIYLGSEEPEDPASILNGKYTPAR